MRSMRTLNQAIQEMLPSDLDSIDDNSDYGGLSFCTMSEQKHGDNTQVSFVLETAYTLFGQEVFIVGSHPCLGSWKIKKALKLYTNGYTYP